MSCSLLSTELYSNAVLTVVYTFLKLIHHNIPFFESTESLIASGLSKNKTCHIIASKILPMEHPKNSDIQENTRSQSRGHYRLFFCP